MSNRYVAVFKKMWRTCRPPKKLIIPTKEPKLVLGLPFQPPIPPFAGPIAP